MDAVFVSKLKTLLEALAEKMDVYVPANAAKHIVFSKYDPKSSQAVEFNAVRACTPVKEFLFPLREVAATMQAQTQVSTLKPFAVVGLKDCDLRSIAILDKVFAEDDFKDPLYMARREKMFVVSSDCTGSFLTIVNHLLTNTYKTTKQIRNPLLSTASFYLSKVYLKRP